MNHEKEQQLELLLEFRPRTFYVIFCDSDSHMMSVFLKKGFNHCYLLERLEFIWMMFDPTRSGLNVVLPHCDTEHPLIENMMRMEPALKVLEVVTVNRTESIVNKPKLLSCVSATEYIMGLDFNFCLTPHSLYKRLLKAKHPNIQTVREMPKCQQEKVQPKELNPEPWKQLERIELGESK